MAGTVYLRAARVQDAPAIAHVHVESWRTTYAGIVPEALLASLDETERTQSWRDWLTRDIQTYVAEESGEIVGFASGGPIREPLLDYDTELFAIYLLQQHQRRGLGTSLLRDLAQSLRARGCRSMAVWVLEDNSSGRFYERSGALPLLSKQIELGGAVLPVRAFGWPDFDLIPALREE